MTTPNSDVAAELWSLAETVLTRLEPLLRQAVQDQESSPRQGCSWCPVCALAALIRGEQHDLVTLLASEGSSVIALIRQLVSEHVDPSGPATPAGHTAESSTASPGDPADSPPRSGPSGTSTEAENHTDDTVIRRAAFEPITVIVKDPATSDPRD